MAARLAEAVPDVVDCDRVGVFLWHEDVQELAFFYATKAVDAR